MQPVLKRDVKVNVFCLSICCTDAKRQTPRSKGQILGDLAMCWVLIEDNDPKTPAQHEINTNRPAHLLFRLRGFRLHMAEPRTQSYSNDTSSNTVELCKPKCHQCHHHLELRLCKCWCLFMIFWKQCDVILCFPSVLASFLPGYIWVKPHNPHKNEMQ